MQGTSVIYEQTRAYQYILAAWWYQKRSDENSHRFFTRRAPTRSSCLPDLHPEQGEGILMGIEGEQEHEVVC